MRTQLLALALALALTDPGFAVAAAPAEMQALEQEWHACLRQAIAHQPAGQSRAGNERNALDECKDREDAFVAAIMADRPQTIWARAWSTVVAPLASWGGLFRH